MFLQTSRTPLGVGMDVKAGGAVLYVGVVSVMRGSLVLCPREPRERPLGCFQTTWTSGELHGEASFLVEAKQLLMDSWRRDDCLILFAALLRKMFRVLFKAVHVGSFLLQAMHMHPFNFNTSSLPKGEFIYSEPRQKAFPVLTPCLFAT